MNKKFIIREMKIEDYETVVKIWTSVEGVVLSDADAKDEISLFLNRNSGFSFVAAESDKVIGAILCGHDGRRGYLHHLAVEAQYRGNKLGKKLVEHCLIKLKEEGIRKCHLFVLENNQQGMDFWSHIGFHKREDINIFSMNV